LPSLKQHSAVSCRLAEPGEGPLVQRLVAQGGGPTWDWLDWSSVYPYWLIGEVDGEPKGCVMASPGLPFGRIEMLCVDQALPKKQKAILVRDLGYAAVASCKAMGCKAVLATVGYGDESWAGVMKRRGWREIDFGSFLVKRI